MRLKFLFIIGAIGGYLLGARAGRKKYEQLKARANEAWEDPRVQKAVADSKHFVEENAPIVAEKVTEGAKVASEKVAEGAKVASEKVSEGAKVASEKIAETAKTASGTVSEGTRAAVSTAQDAAETIAVSARVAADKVAETAKDLSEKVAGVAKSVSGNSASDTSKDDNEASFESDVDGVITVTTDGSAESASTGDIDNAEAAPTIHPADADAAKNDTEDGTGQHRA